MTGILSFLFTLLLFILLFLKRYRTAKLLLLFNILILLLVGQGWLLRLLLGPIQTTAKSNLNWKPNNTIVVLGFGAFHLPSINDLRTHSLGASRLYEGQRLYYDCKSHVESKCALLLSGGDPGNFGKSEALSMKDELVNVGVDENDIIIEGKSNNTFQNAKFSSRILSKYPDTQVLLVTSGLHLKRSLLYFSHFGIEAIGMPSDYTHSVDTNFPSSINFTYTDMVIHEYLGIARYHLYNLMGWNTQSPVPDST